MITRGFQAPLEFHDRADEKGRPVNFDGPHLVFKKRELSFNNISWMSTMLSPCIFIATVRRDAQNNFQEARVGHFSTRFTNNEIDRFLLSLETPPKRTRIWIAGLANKSSHDSLKETTERLVERIIHFGVPLEIEWESEEHPLLRDPRSDQIISDIGFGLLSDRDKIEHRLYRYISFGITFSHSFLVSTILRKEPGSPSMPWRTTIITENAGILTKDHFKNTP